MMRGRAGEQAGWETGLTSTARGMRGQAHSVYFFALFFFLAFAF